ncbi:hypothetical protein ACFSHP_20770 [Novosphingobium panipatense]
MLDDATMARLLDEQHWSVGHWRASAADIIHRRFFNITELIGVRQEDPDVFALTHRWIIDQVGAGRIQGLRVDHIDGLARPEPICTTCVRRWATPRSGSRRS